MANPHTSLLSYTRVVLRNFRVLSPSICSLTSMAIKPILSLTVFLFFFYLVASPKRDKAPPKRQTRKRKRSDEEHVSSLVSSRSREASKQEVSSSRATLVRLVDTLTSDTENEKVSHITDLEAEEDKDDQFFLNLRKDFASKSEAHLIDA